MLRKFREKFSKLPQSNKAMVYLTWLYFIGMSVTTIFVNIYVFKIHNDITENILYSMLFFCSTFVGFSVVGYFVSIFRKNIRNLYYIGYILFVFSFISIFVFEGQIIGAYIFALVYGMGNGNFWCTLHTQELKNIEDKNRDFYSSSISAGRNILEIGVPFGVAITFFFGEKFSFDGYKIVFGFLPFIYLGSFFFIKDIDSYYPKKINKSDFINFFNLKKYKYGHLYFLIGGLQSGLSVVIYAIVSITLLKSETNIGLFQALLGVISTFIIVHLGLKRNIKNRLKYFGIIASGLCINILIFSFNFSVIGLIFYSLVVLLLQPLFSVSTHVYNLKLMDNVKHGKSDFYPAMLLREVILWIGRIGTLGILYFIAINFNFVLEDFLRMGLVMIGILLLLLFGSIYLWEKNEK